MRKLNIGQILWERDHPDGRITGTLYEIVKIHKDGSIDIRLKGSPKSRVARRVYPFFDGFLNKKNQYTVSPFQNQNNA